MSLILIGKGKEYINGKLEIKNGKYKLNDATIVICGIDHSYTGKLGIFIGMSESLLGEYKVRLDGGGTCRAYKVEKIKRKSLSDKIFGLSKGNRTDEDIKLKAKELWGERLI